MPSYGSQGSPGVPGSHRTVTIKETVLGRLPPSGHCTDSRLEHNLSLSVKEAICLSWSLNLRGRFQVWHTSRGVWRCSQGRYAWEPSLCSPFASLLLTGISQTGVYTLISNPEYCDCCPWDTSRLSDSGG